MKKVLFLSTIFILLLFSVSFGQEKVVPKPRTIALFNSFAFEDEKNGIKKLVDAESIANNPGFIAEQDKKKRLEIYKEVYRRREETIVKPVKSEIAALIKQIGNQNNIVLLDGIELQLNGQLLGFNEKLNITEILIPEINEYFKTGSKPNLKVNLPSAKIAVINPNTFSDEKTGVKGYLQEIEKAKRQIQKETGNNPKIEEIVNRIRINDLESNIVDKIFKAMQSYTKLKEFSLILDSTKKIPEGLENFPIQDITKEFISYYNQSNP